MASILRPVKLKIFEIKLGSNNMPGSNSLAESILPSSEINTFALFKISAVFS